MDNEKVDSRTGSNEYEPLPNKPPALDMQSREDGTLLLSCPYPPGEPARSTAHILLETAAAHPERTLIAEQNDAGEWRHLSYADAVAGCRCRGAVAARSGSLRNTPVGHFVRELHHTLSDGLGCHIRESALCTP